MADESLSYAAPPNGLRMLIDRLLAAEKRIAALEGASPLRQAGVTATKTGLTADRSLTVNGNFASTGNAEITGNAHVGGTTLIDGTTTIDDELIVTADAEFGGTVDVTGLMTLLSDMIVNGLIRSQNFVANTSGWRLTSTGLEVNTLTAKDAIIGNQALAAPVIPSAGNGAATTTITTSWVDYASVAFTVPADCTTANVIGVSAISTPASQLDQVATVVNGTVGTEMPAFGTAAPASYATVLTGLTPGGTVTVASRCRNVSGSGAGVRVITTSASVTFLR